MKNGIYTNLSNADYHKNLTHNSSSTLKLALEDPLEYYRTRVLKKPSSKEMSESALLLGNFIHTWILEPHLLWEDYAVFEGSVKRGKAWEIFQLENEGKSHLSSSQYEMCQKLIENFNKTVINIDDSTVIRANELFKNGVAEESIFTELEGELIKIRTDYKVLKCPFTGKIAIRDVKTTSDKANTLKEVKKIIRDYTYDLSAALYVDVVAKECKVDPNEIIFDWVFLSKNDYKTNVYRMGKNTYEKGRQKYLNAIELIKDWKATGNYVKTDIREV